MNARDFAALAQEAYDASPDIGIADSASRAIVRQTADGLVIAFRGSDDVDSWIHDLDTIPMPVPGMGSVHQGFYEAFVVIEPQVIAAIGDKPVTLVGHSLGASLALVAAASLTLAGKPPVAVWAFEPARISFDLTLRNLLAKMPMHLFKNGSDPVPDVPIGGMHPALLTHIGKPAGVVPIIADHMLPAVIADLPQS